MRFIILLITIHCFKPALAQFYDRDQLTKEAKQTLACLKDEQNLCPPKSIFIKNRKQIGDKKLKVILTFLITLNNPQRGFLFDEIVKSIEYNSKSPVDPVVLAFIIPNFFDQWFGYNHWLKGKKNGVITPIDSMLWHEDHDIASKDLKYGFHRLSSLTDIHDQCDYIGPKTGYGTRPGFKVECHGEKIKVKFAEIHSEPFATRVLWALGYNVEPVDYHPGLKINYDRKMFTEFNSRKKIPISVIAFWMKIKVANHLFKHNFFDYVQNAVLKNGKGISRDELKIKFDTKDDGDVDYLVTSAAQVQIANNQNIVEVGQWSINDFDHPKSIAMRRLSAISAWLAWYDVRRDNNKIVLEVKPDKSIETKFVLADVGSMLGSSNSPQGFFNKIERSNLFRTDVSKPNGRLKFVQVIEKNLAFKKATKEDFVSGLKLINQLTDQQIYQALVASGFTGDELQQFFVKLKSRREKLSQNFNLHP